jgi:uncharacterized membrane protein
VSLLSQSGLIFVAYLAAGRVGAIATCLILGISPWETLFIALLIDGCQIPVYGLILETSKKHVALPKRFQNWAEAKSEKFKTRVLEKKSWQHVLRFQPAAIVIVSTVPIRGFGVLSACILAVMLGYDRIYGTVLIMIGSFIGSFLSVWAIFFPGRFFGVL